MAELPDSADEEDNQLNEDGDEQTGRRWKFPPSCTRVFYWILMCLFFLLVAVRIVSLVNFISYDTRCMIFEHASVIDCHQDGLIPDPESWIFAWILLSILSSIVVLCIICTDELLNAHCDDLKGAFRKGSFISFILLSIATIGYYIVRACKIDEFSGINIATSITLILWPLVILGVVWVLNYVLPVEKANCCSISISCMFYWTALIMYLLETGFKLFAAMLDTAYQIAPVVERQFPEESLKGIIVILSGFRLAFHARVFLFFWNKIFHGDKDLFSVPCSKLERRQRSQRSQPEDAAATSVELQPHVGNEDEEGSVVRNESYAANVLG